MSHHMQECAELVDDQWLSDRGNLHDARIQTLKQQDGELHIAISDQWSNFAGLDHYRGRCPGTLVLKGVLEISGINSSALSELIMDAIITHDTSGICLSISTFGYERAVFAKGTQLVWRSQEQAIS